MESVEQYDNAEDSPPAKKVKTSKNKSTKKIARSNSSLSESSNSTESQTSPSSNRPKETGKRKDSTTSFPVENSTPRFKLEAHPQSVQRKCYAKETRTMSPKPLVIVSDDNSGDAPVVAGIVKASLVDAFGKKLREDVSSILECRCEDGLTHQFEKLRNDSPTIWAKFNLHVTDTTGGKFVRLKFKISYVVKIGEETRAFQEILYSKQFEVIPKKKIAQLAELITETDKSLAHITFEGEGKAHKIKCLKEVPEKLEDLVNNGSNLLEVDVDRPFQCTFVGCGKRFIRADHLRRHTDTQHLGVNLENFACELCDKKFSTSSRLVRHQLVHNKAYPCDFEGCNFTSDKENLLAAHKRKVHFPESGPPCKCQYEGCSAAYEYPSQLEHHMKTHKPKTLRALVSKYYCAEIGCGEGFPSKDKILLHMKKDHQYIDVKEMCPICNVPFVALSLHMQRSHKVERPIFTCRFEGCTSAFFSKSNHDEHVKLVHENDEPTHACTFEGCHEVFWNTWNLDQHIKIHNRPQQTKRKASAISSALGIREEDQIENEFEGLLPVDPESFNDENDEMRVF